jgi:hypothetical protein
VACLGQSICTCSVLVVKPERQRLLGRHRRRSKDNINIDLQQIVGGGLEQPGLNRNI